jgi:hypothetical protein
MRLVSTSLAAALGLLVCVGASAQTLVVDDFTQTSDSSLFPATADAVFPAFLQFVEDPFGTIAGNDAARTVIFSPILSAQQVIDGGFSGQQTVDLDTAAGTLSTTSTGDGAPAFGLVYTGDAVDNNLDLNVTGTSFLEFYYSSNDNFSADLALTNNDDAGTIVAGNNVTIDFTAGDNRLLVPLSSITGAVSVGLPPNQTTAPNVNLTSLDGLSLLTGIGSSPATPEGLAFTLDRVAFVVPEPGSLALLSGALLAGAARRRRG